MSELSDVFRSLGQALVLAEAARATLHGSFSPRNVGDMVDLEEGIDEALAGLEGRLDAVTAVTVRQHAMEAAFAAWKRA
ncbi:MULTISPECIES: hypothetical protein [unclassified Chelatococcus]|uniref:hypothetical protein n=1 Tax=unclassified Chelatococcus TaxID=2638111 RepID=UPI001BCAA744|nr:MULTISPECIES: hypothetical protein [unclassified Chelatococcus]MBS7696231.1 hypothetical protein [Chelatococcus sp. YT9]MBS7697568.1 hypothetical protein [Chelatococcus sp. YT9]MBX3560115.1 hypothetical protein [Chelatococcus sp.]